MRVLFLHQNFPGQFVHVAQSLHQSGHEVRAITDAANTRPDIVPTLRYRLPAFNPAGIPPLARHYAVRTVRGEIVAKAMLELKRSGFTPDVVVGHPGWGETLFVKDVWPAARLIVHAEFYYRSEGADLGFDPEFGEPGFDLCLAVRAKNAALLAALADADAAVAPTEWQARQFPPELRSKITILHEGIDTDLIRPDPAMQVTLGSGVTLKAGDEIVTFVSRNLEPYRGYHIFMRALPEILLRRPNARAVIIGGRDVSYGPPPGGGRSWAQIFLDEVKDRLPLDRVHFIGKVPHRTYLSLLQVSAAHVYLTYPFVLSWSMLEAMSAAALLIGSQTPPVEEVVEDGVNGRLVDFFDKSAIAETVVESIAHQDRFRAMRDRARDAIIGRYDLKRHCLPAWLRFVKGSDSRG